MMKNILLLIRPHQWLKNTFIFLPLFFGGLLTDWPNLLACIIAFFSFSFAASSIYCFNDICDIESDRKHPVKCRRPVASGAISLSMGYLTMFVCAGLSLLFALYFQSVSRTCLLTFIALYYGMNIAYCIRIKKIVLMDIFVIAAGFVLRILVGGAATGIWISHWIILMTFLLALFLAFAKRRDDVVIYEKTGIKARENIDRYNLAFMNQTIGIIASITIVCYIMYTVSEEVIQHMNNQYLYTTSIFVLAGIIRYLQLTIVDVRSGSPTRILMKDRFIQCCILGWIVAFIFIIYF